MGLVDGTAIVTPTEVEEITHEVGLSNLNGTDATITNSCKWATAVIIDELDGRGIPCDKIANPARLKRAAAYIAASLAIGGTLKDAASQTQAAAYMTTARQLLAGYRFVSSDLPAQPGTNLLLPLVGNVDDTGPAFSGRTECGP